MNPKMPLQVDRRTTLKWLAATMTATAAACGRDQKILGSEIPAAPLPAGKAASKATVSGYGGDPDLLNPAVLWPRTLTEAQLRTTAALCDAILPADEHSPAASVLGVHEFIDEWVSAPYPQQQEDRNIVLAGLEWLESRSERKFGTAFHVATDREQTELLDGLARREQRDLPDARFFERFRFLTVGAFYTTEAGMADVGYIGNVPLNGSYPGPSHEAMSHLAGILRQLGLRLPA